jgi:hypothetical protein
VREDYDRDSALPAHHTGRDEEITHNHVVAPALEKASKAPSNVSRTVPGYLKWTARQGVRRVRKHVAEACHLGQVERQQFDACKRPAQVAVRVGSQPRIERKDRDLMTLCEVAKYMEASNATAHVERQQSSKVHPQYLHYFNATAGRPEPLPEVSRDVARNVKPTLLAGSSAERYASPHADQIEHLYPVSPVT